MSEEPRRRSVRELAAVLVGFLLFAGYGLLRWQTLLLPGERLRLLVLLSLAMLVAALVLSWGLLTVRFPPLARRGVRPLAMFCVAAVTLVVMASAAGLPIAWLLHLRFGAMATAVRHGIKVLPAVNVPYKGHSRAIRTVIALAAGALMLLAGLALSGFCARAPRATIWSSLGIAAAALLVLATVPSLIGKPPLAGLVGALTFVAIVALVHGWSVPRGRLTAAAALVAACAIGGLVISRVIHPPRGLVNFTHVVSSLGPAAPARFDWSQTYGPLGPSGANRVVLRVQAHRTAYWKTQNLDAFNGQAWVQSDDPQSAPVNSFASLVGVDRSSLRRWTQTLKITDVAMDSPFVVAAGTALPPVTSSTFPQPLPGASAGTWMFEPAMRPGVRYSVAVYTPAPTAKQLRHDPANYPAALRRAELAITLPAGTTVQFGPAGADQGISAPTPLRRALARSELQRSALWPVYRLSRRLRAGAATPYQYVAAVDQYLHDGFTYVRNPPRRRDPIVAFLTRTRRGYCQQFAGAMALLLRMGGVPARVAVGFENGTLEKGSYQVTASDAHAWVEAWFPGYGWVTFDPTPSATDVTTAASDAGGSGAERVVPRSGDTGASGAHSQHALGSQGLAPSSQAAGRHPVSGPAPAVVVLGVLCGLGLLLVIGLGVRWSVGRRRLDALPGGRALAELQAAFARCGRPLNDGVTLAELERFLNHRDAGAAAYVRGLRLMRFGQAASPPTAAQRRALRSWLGAGRGLRGRARALLALPPQFLHL